MAEICVVRFSHCSYDGGRAADGRIPCTAPKRTYFPFACPHHLCRQEKNNSGGRKNAIQPVTPFAVLYTLLPAAPSARRRPVGGDGGSSRAIGVRAGGKKITPIATKEAAQGADGIVWVARDGTPRILLELQTSIYTNYPGFWPEVTEVDVSTGRMKTVVRSTEHVSNWYADASGAVRMGTGFNS